MSSVLLIRPLCAQGELEFAEPLGIERLAGFLRAHGSHDVRLFDRRLFEEERHAGLAGAEPRGFFEELARCYAGGLGPQVVGFSLMTSTDVPDALRILSRLKVWWPASVFVAGGMYVTTDPEGAARKFPRDVVLLPGEGELQLLSLADSVQASEGAAGNRSKESCATAVSARCAGLSREETAAARGCAGGFGGGSVGKRSGAPAPVEPDLWSLPFRPDLERYARLKCAVNVQTSRGCVGACRFCATPSLPQGLGCWKPRSLELVVDELQVEAQRLERAGLPPVFNFVDDDFGSLGRLEKLAEEVERRGLRITYACEMRFASLASQPHLSERLARLRGSGLTRLFFGLESLNPMTLASWGKPLDLGKLPAVLGACRSAEVAVRVGYILWHGTQTVQGARDEAKRMRQLGIYTHRAALSRLIVFPGSALCSNGISLHGFEPMHPEVEAFYRRFSAETEELTGTWTKAAVDEPHSVAEARLGRGEERSKQIERELEELNARSYEQFMQMSDAWERNAVSGMQFLAGKGLGA